VSSRSPAVDIPATPCPKALSISTFDIAALTQQGSIVEEQEIFNDGESWSSYW
jgi:hypothetical protein